MTMLIFTTFFLLLCGHALADFALQNSWVATNKNRHAREMLTKEEQDQFQVVWPWLLSAHSLHHGLMVYLITQKIELGIGETVIHWMIDYGKTEEWYGFHTDQVLHVATKVVWVVMLYYQIV